MGAEGVGAAGGAAAGCGSGFAGAGRFLAGLVGGEDATRGVAKELEELLRSGDFGRITTSLSARLRKMATALDARGGDKEDGKKTERLYD